MITCGPAYPQFVVVVDLNLLAHGGPAAGQEEAKGRGQHVTVLGVARAVVARKDASKSPTVAILVVFSG